MTRRSCLRPLAEDVSASGRSSSHARKKPLVPRVTFFRLVRRLRASSQEPGYRDGTRTNFALGSCEKFQPGVRDEKRQSEDFCREMRERKRTWRNTKIITFVPVIALATLVAVSLQLNGMLMMWKIQQATQDDVIRLKSSLKLGHVPDCPLFFRLRAM